MGRVKNRRAEGEVVVGQHAYRYIQHRAQAHGACRTGGVNVSTLGTDESFVVDDDDK